MATVVQWTGREVRALRQAKRMSLRTFAAHLGVQERLVSKWEAGGASWTPRPANQAALDSVLSSSPPDVRERFAAIITRNSGASEQPGEILLSAPVNSDTTHHPRDGKLMARVPEGIFLKGKEDEPLWLPEFWIDVYPTTNAEYARFVAMTDRAAPRHWGGVRPPEAIADHPVVWVTWTDAVAYAAWAGRVLPTSAQWEKAARGPAGGTYPWGNTVTHAKCNVRETAIGATTPVHRFHSGVSPYGVYDLCGNVWEWLSTESQPGRYELKGSAFTSPFGRADPAIFNDADKGMCDDDSGFRCAVATLSPGH